MLHRLQLRHCFRIVHEAKSSSSALCSISNRFHSTDHGQKNRMPVIARHSTSCPCCINLLQQRFIHRPETFKEAIRKPFEWGYGTDNGPYSWFLDFPIALEGHRQSPIHILTKEVVNDKFLKKIPLRWNYDSSKVDFIENTGRSWTVHVNGCQSALTGGPLTSEYDLWQFHAHWGNANSHGSEHTVDGKTFPGELHLVHWNRSKYKSPHEAVTKPDGLAVLGIFFEVSDDCNEELKKVCNLFDKITFRDQKTECVEPIDVRKFLPNPSISNKYWTYDGSLTTPPLLECVTWILFQQTLKVSEDQLDKMRSLRFISLEEYESGRDEFMVNNFRPALAAGHRIIREC